MSSISLLIVIIHKNFGSSILRGLYQNYSVPISLQIKNKTKQNQSKTLEKTQSIRLCQKQNSIS